ncbi:ATPase [Thermoanaerobacter kivui]|uniref:ATPase n=1 Tax=Thermoanaerobacter kivui TaxID=2325 RepID=A0A097ARX0_THEKI|nr:ATPase [Thermoanaerobacter kivui]AIS52571.1 ATPase [Thermoanaerobacter kivui]
MSNIGDLEVFNLLDELEDIIERSSTIPLSNKAIVSKEEILDLIKQIRIKLPDEFKRAEWIKQERQRILLDAQQDAETIIKDAEQKINEMVNESEIVKRAEKTAAEIISAAQANAKEIRLGSREYADELLAKIEAEITNILETIKKNREELRGTK